MSHFAKINNSNKVTEVIVAEQDFINSGVVGDAFLWVQTSYNGNFRGGYATIGSTWDEVNKVFVAAKPYPSWVLNETFHWEAPVARPDDDKMYAWDEETTSWVEVNVN